MPRFFEVERITTSKRHFIIEADSQAEAEAIAKQGMAQNVKRHSKAEQILYLTNNTVATVRVAENAEELNPHMVSDYEDDDDETDADDRGY